VNDVAVRQIPLVHRTKSDRGDHGGAKSDAPSFTFTFKGGKFGIGGEKTSVHALMPFEETEGFLRANEKTTVVDRPGNPVIKVEPWPWPNCPRRMSPARTGKGARRDDLEG
jgi:hypothetical protein